MEKNSTTIILICAIIFIISAFVVFCLKISSISQNNVRKITQQSTTTQTNKIQNNKITQNRVPNANKTNGMSIATGMNSMFLIILLVISIFFIIIPTISYWKIYLENGENGLASIIPIYSKMVLYRIVGLKEWYVLLAFIPFVGIIISSIISLYATYLLGQKYKKSILFVFGLIFLPFIFLPILALSKLPRKYDAFYESY